MRNVPKFIIHLLSGGLDSVTMLYDLKAQGHRLHCIGFDYQQKHSRELLAARRHCERAGVAFSRIALPALGGLTDASWVVPNRNAILLSHAVNLAVEFGASTVTFGANKEDEAGFPDCRKAFVEAINEMTAQCELHVEIIAPYLNRSKAWIVTKAKSLGVPLNSIWTCYRGGEKPCGTCPACQKLKKATLCGK